MEIDAERDFCVDDVAMEEGGVPKTQDMRVVNQLRVVARQSPQCVDECRICIMVAEQIMDAAFRIDGDKPFEPLKTLLDGFLMASIATPPKVKDIPTQHKRVRRTECVLDRGMDARGGTPVGE